MYIEKKYEDFSYYELLERFVELCHPKYSDDDTHKMVKALMRHDDYGLAFGFMREHYISVDFNGDGSEIFITFDFMVKDIEDPQTYEIVIDNISELYRYIIIACILKKEINHEE